MINLKGLRITIENYIMMTGKIYLREGVSKRITIKRKKKMVIEQTKNGNVRAVRKNIIKIEIIE